MRATVCSYVTTCLVISTLLLLTVPCTGSNRPHIGDPSSVDHILILRFCLPKANTEIKEEVCSAYVTLFEKTLLLSLHVQNADFRMLVYVHDKVRFEGHRAHTTAIATLYINSQMSEPLHARLHALLAPFTYQIVSVPYFFEPGWHDAHMAAAKVHYNMFIEVWLMTYFSHKQF